MRRRRARSASRTQALPLPPDVVDGADAVAVAVRAAAEVLSPDKKHAAFIRDSNLWVRDAATNKETALTTDGIKDFGYATDNAGWASSNRPIVLWSPDSKRIATFQQDQRGVGEMYLVETKVGHPTLQAWKYPLPGDEVVTTIQRVTIDLDGPRVVRLQMPPDQHRSTLCDNVACRGGEWADVQWDKEGAKLAFVSTSRDHKQEVLRIADATTGAVHDVLEEKVPHSSRAATAASTGATCRSPRSSSGSASATTGATSTSTIPRPAS